MTTWSTSPRARPTSARSSATMRGTRASSPRTSSALQGKQMLRHQALGESYVRKYDLPRAIDQFDIASKAKDGDFYLQSKVEARLKTLRQQLKLEQGDDKNG